MTVLTKPSIVIKKPDGTKTPLVLDNTVYDEEAADSLPTSAAVSGWKRPRYQPRTKGTLFGLSIITFLVIATGIAGLVLLYRHTVLARRNVRVKLYESYCTIPVEPDSYVAMSEYPNTLSNVPHQVISLSWTGQPEWPPTGNTTQRAPDDDVTGNLNEKFDIYAQVEYVRVYDNGRTVTVVQDFNQKITGIIDKDRCFVTEMDDNMVLSPELFVVSIENDAPFDVTRVHTPVRAALPPLSSLDPYREISIGCIKKPTYYLQKESWPVLRKREIGNPMRDYVYFAGKHVQSIEILNLDDVVYSEKEHAE